MVLHSLNSKQNGSALVIVLVAVVLVAVVGAGVYITKGDSKKENGTSPQNSTATPFKSITATNTADVKSLFSAAKAGTYDAKCSYTDDSGKNSAIYISGAEKMRIDTTIDNKSGHMLVLGKTAYIWAEGNAKGSTIPVTNSSNSSTSTDKFADNVEKYKLSCQSVSRLDASLFKQPTDVTFTDFNSQIKPSSYESN